METRVERGQASEDEVTGAIERQTSMVPSSLFLRLALGSMAVSAVLKLSGKNHWALWRIKMKLGTIFVACTLLALASAALAQQDQAPRSAERITKEVRHELLMLPYLGVFDNLAYKVDGYNVTLVGQVTRPTLKSDAENVVKRIEGVEHVDNQVEVLPPSPMDESLRRQLYRAIYGYPALQKYALGVQQPIRIIVRNGKVALEGVVDNEGDKNIANIRANGVPGVFSVTNNLQVVKTNDKGLKE